MKNTFHIFAALWLIAACSMGSSTPCMANTAVALHGDSDLHAPTVRLSDLFSGVPVVIDRDIAQAPMPGKSATYDARILAQLAEKYRLTWSASSLSDHVTVTTPGTHIAIEDLQKAVKSRIEQTGVHGDIDVTFENRNLDINLPADQKPDFTFNNFDFDPVSKHFHGDIVAGRGSASITVALSGKASVHRHVPVLAHHLESGSIIAVTDIDWATVPEDRVTGNVITSADQLIGREVRHALNDGDVLHTTDIIPARLVTRGSLVTLKIETAFMQLTAQGRALQDGAEGEVVRVNNTQSNRMVEGTVTGAGEVTVHISSPKLASAQ